MTTTKKPTTALTVKKAPTKRATAGAPVPKVTKTKEQVQQVVVKKVAKKAMEIIKQGSPTPAVKKVEPKAKVARTKTSSQIGLGVKGVVKAIAAQLPETTNVKKILKGKAKPINIPVGKVTPGVDLKSDKGTVKVTKVVKAEKPLPASKPLVRRTSALQKASPRIDITIRVQGIDTEINNLTIVPYVNPKCFGLPSKETILGISGMYDYMAKRYYVGEQITADNHEVVLQAIHATRTYNPGQVYTVASEEEALVFLMTYMTARLMAFQSAINSRMHVAYLKHIGSLGKPKAAKK